MFEIGESRGLLAKRLRQGDSILLLGEPGMGKSTTALLTAQELLLRPGEEIIVFVRARELTDIAASGRALETTLEVACSRRPPWPLADAGGSPAWIVVVDGLDEMTVPREKLIPFIVQLSKRVTVLITCRRYDYERSFTPLQSAYNGVVALQPWRAEDIAEYVAALRRCGRERAARMVESFASSRDDEESVIVNVPFWISIITYLAENYRKGPLRQLDNVYDLLFFSVAAVADEEVARYTQYAPALTAREVAGLWRRSAWILHCAEREGRELTVDDLATSLGLPRNDPAFSTMLGLLNTKLDIVIGFFHKVFAEFCLAVEIGERILKGDPSHLETVRPLGYQRSIVTNRLLRSHLERDAVRAVDNLISVFELAGVGDRGQFAQNQVLYLLGRIPLTSQSRTFLEGRWHDARVPPFVRYAAGFAAVVAGDIVVEEEFYERLCESEADAALNLAYHRYYYGDVDLSESAMPPEDDGGPADATLIRLLERVKSRSRRHRNALCIDLATVRAFLETHRRVPSLIREPGEVLRGVMDTVDDTNRSSTYLARISKEIRRILKLLG